MGRRRKRVCLEEGLSLNIDWLRWNNFFEAGSRISGKGISWTLPGNVIASANIETDMRGSERCWLEITMSDFKQRVEIAGQRRHFGGRQLYFVCPRTNRSVSTIWKPPGADIFASREAWAGQVAYLSQFGTYIDRAHIGKSRAKRRLCGTDENPAARSFPDKPSRMHASTYAKYARRFYAYQQILDRGLEALIVED
ncbi:hypothetical protein [Bradyrhizobium sp. SUTN9-2]|uniref:hypothetical protein n=1 Tax=Bradyrhizobium sp. SUTN9-2 TaxID=1167456 RepID=UPI0011B1FE44|nr:hypothetical protein [Bradyrhizobium sp. SUTN9-2]